MEEAEKVFLLNPRSETSYSLKGDAYYLMGNVRRAEEEYRKIFELSGDKSTHFFPRFSLAGLFLAQGKIEKAKLELEQAVSLADELKMRAWRPGPLAYRAYLISLKDPVEANKELEKALILYRELDNTNNLISSLNWRGMLLIRMGSLEKARGVSKELKEMIDQEMNKKLMRLYYQLEGAIELENKNYAGAIGYFSRAVSLLPSPAMPNDEHAYFMEPLASAYFRSGDLAKARDEYEKITALTSGRAGYGDIYARSFFMLGKIRET